MNRMIKRRKDDGFTLIELMIVIAVIGILAVVLVPKVGSIKTQAKSAGVDVNVRTIEGYVQSRINYWNSNNSGVKVVGQDILDTITASTITNPISNKLTIYAAAAVATAETGTEDHSLAAANALQILAADPASGSEPPGGVVVVVTSNASVKITGYDANQNITRSTTIVP